MYAVGKVGSLISRSVYTVSGPFHPFGGAVDIVVVQQQDGSFKSSPWYVRFGKFQGVLKTREKVVNIAVNGAEAGFHMYLDSNGEAYFLRDAGPNAEEGVFVVSPASSGDEQEAPMQESVLRKSKSISCDSSTMEADAGDGKILARTTSRRTTILERMFGRKSVKDNAHAVDRVTSLERAEIAAELLDTKWSTNLSRGSKTHGSSGEPSKSNVTDASNSDQVESSKHILPGNSLDHGKESGADCNTDSPREGRSSSVDETDHCLQTTNVREEVVEIYAHESSEFTDRITSTTDQPGSEFFSENLGTDKSINESVDAHGELLHSFEDVAGRELHANEVLSNAIVELQAVETDITNDKTEGVSQFVIVDSDGTNKKLSDANSPTYGTTAVSTERHEVSLITSAEDEVQEKMVIISSTETVESSYTVSSVLADKVHESHNISLTDGVQHEEHPGVLDGKIEQLTPEERPLACYSSSSNKEDKIILVVQDQEDPVMEDSSFQTLQDNGPETDISVGTVADYNSTDSAHDVACQHDVVCPDASSRVVEILRYAPENDPEGITKDSTMENKAYNEELDVSVTQTSTAGDGPIECIVQSAIFANKVDLEGFPIINGPPSLGKADEQNTKIEDDANRSSSVSGAEIGFVPKAIVDPREEAGAVVSFSEFIEDIQFQFGDTESFADRKAMDDITENKTAGEEHDESDCDAEELEGGDADPANELEKCSDPPRPESSPVPIPGSELHTEDNNMEARSLPILRSHINDLERSDDFQLSCSLRSNDENNRVEPVNCMNPAFPEQEPESTGDSEKNSSPPKVTSNAIPDNKHTDDLKVDSFNPFAELSLCRHLLSEGMGEDAARTAFDSEKVTLEKFRTMKQSLIRNNKLVVRIAGRYFPWDAAAPIVLGMVSFSEEQVFEPQGMIKVERVEPNAGPGGSWRIWPFSFRRTRTISAIQPVCEGTVESSLSTPVKELDRERNKCRPKRMERKVRSLTPTSEELASLDLKAGRNVVTFTFSTAMLGRQQVDCCIYLWKWNTRIVISDVDGTITKSDVLGQFMPLVGVDWSQNGVAHLFSAIKENGYQLLFLSARAISQAHLTRQFLFNLKQDGKALPDGPVVISPDGLFPSLYREVIRRAPHEFKISCLEAIRALFPPDSNPNPFYAGFGNRDTDELSYLKVGIPMGKIFIINPKGEVAVNRRVDTKSYTSLHVLVNGMFPPISSSPEQEDYNTWNYWKMPLPSIDI